MRPTRRGYAVLAVVAVAVANAWLAGPRALNAIAAPLVVAVLAAAIQVRRTDAPTVERSEPKRGFPGERRTVEVRVEGSGVATITESVDGGIQGGVTVQRTLPATVEYTVDYEHRGVHRFGETTVAVGDVLGLVVERHTVSEPTEAVVYPPVYSLKEGAFDRTLGPESDERTEFDRLREYVSGDSLRDVAWKASAKHRDLLVTEFTDPADEESVAIAARADEGRADEMATAAASLVVAALRAGLAVELAVPDGSLPEGYGPTHQTHALELLARTGAGEVPEADWAGTGVRVDAGDEVTVAVDGTTHDLAALTATRDNPLVAGGPA